MSDVTRIVTTTEAHRADGRFDRDLHEWLLATVPPPPPYVPAAPSDVRATVVTPTSLTAGYRDNSDNEAGFDTEYTAAAAEAWAAFVVTATGLTPDTAYRLRARAYNDVGQSAWAYGEARTAALPPATEYPTPPLRTPPPDAIRIAATALGTLQPGKPYVVEAGTYNAPWDVPAGTELWALGVVTTKGAGNRIVTRFNKASYTDGFIWQGGGAQGGSAENNRVIARVDGENATVANCVFKDGTDGGLSIMAGGALLVRNVCNHNGTFGLGGTRANGLRAFECTVANNNGRNVADGCGGKFTRSVSQLWVRTRWDNNTGPGGWWDYNNGEIRLAECVSQGNRSQGRYGGNAVMFEVSQGPFWATKCLLDGRAGNEGVFNFGSKDVHVDQSIVYAGAKGACVDADRDDNDHDWPITNVRATNSIIYAPTGKHFTGKFANGGGNTLANA